MALEPVSRATNALPIAAGVGVIVLFAGILLDVNSVAAVGAVILSPPLAVMIYRLITRPPSVVDAIEMGVGVPAPGDELEPPSHNQAKAVLRNTGEEKR